MKTQIVYYSNSWDLGGEAIIQRIYYVNGMSFVFPIAYHEKYKEYLESMYKCKIQFKEKVG